MKRQKIKSEESKGIYININKKEEIPTDIKLFWNLLTRNFKMIIYKYYYFTAGNSFQ